MTPEEKAEERYKFVDEATNKRHDDFNDRQVERRIVYATCIREQVEPLEAWKESAINVLGEWDKVHEALGKPGKLGESMAEASLLEVQKLRALVQVLLDGCNEAIEMQQAQRGCISDAEVNLPTCMNGFSTAKEAGFTPTTDEVR